MMRIGFLAYVKNAQAKASCGVWADTNADQVPHQGKQGDLELLHGHITADVLEYSSNLLHQQVCNILRMKLIVTEIHFSDFIGMASKGS